MSLRSSSALPSKRAILALIQADSEFTSALVRMGLPVEEPTELERANVLPNLPREYVDLVQQGGKHEALKVPVRIEVRMVGRDESDELEDRLEELAARVFDLVEEDRELGGACIDATCDQVEGPFVAPAPANDGWIGSITVQVAVDGWM